MDKNAFYGELAGDAAAEFVRQHVRVAPIVGHPSHQYTQEQLDTAFSAVQDDEHWKNPIDAFIKESARDITDVAIQHFTATLPNFQRMGNGWLRVTATGYRNGPAGP